MKNSILNGIYHLKNSAMDVAESIAKSDYGQKVIPQNFSQELGEAFRTSGYFKSLQAQEGVNSVLSDYISDVAERDKLTRNINGNKLDESLERIREPLKSKLSEEVDVDDALARMRKAAQNEMDSNTTAQEAYNRMHTVDRVTYAPGAYFSHPDSKTRHARMIAAAASAETVAITGRYLSGGTLTRDSYGRKDIAGIPLI